jgi:hypothetical protein
VKNKGNRSILQLVAGRATNVDTYGRAHMCELTVELLSSFDCNWLFVDTGQANLC